MLNIYYGSEKIDKEKFIFDNIKGRTLLLVPDQFSLQAERDAFFYLKEKGLMDLRIVDFSSLGHKIISEVGGKIPQLIDKYGRHMLLTRIVEKNEEKLKVFRNVRGRNNFIELVNGFISEIKRYEINSEELKNISERVAEDSFLRYKLDDIIMIFEEYEKAIDGKYLDSEDYITFYGNKILSSKIVAESDVWIYGFDSFSPKNILVLERILKTAKSLNVVMNYEDSGAKTEGNDAAFLLCDDRAELFKLTGYIINKLREMAEDLNEDVNIKAIDGTRRLNVWDKGPEAITLGFNSDIYAEADRTASYILKLVKEEGYRFSDIVVLCNDKGVRTSNLKRTFQRWGIPAFVDGKRQVTHHPAVRFLQLLIDAAVKGYRTETVINLLKSGVMGFEDDHMELMENYVKKFRIKGNTWKDEFTRTADSFSEEELRHINDIRRIVVYAIEGVKNCMGKYNTAGEKIQGIYKFLENDFKIDERIKGMAEQQAEGGFDEAAAETAQSWNVICMILNQIVAVIGDEKIAGKQLLDMMDAGFKEFEIGIVPVTSDAVVVGTLQRTRVSRVKAVFVIGACDGVLPMTINDEGIISKREKAILAEMDVEISKSESIMRGEEHLAIYRAFSLPSERLYVSCSLSNGDGEDAKPSIIYRQLKDMERFETIYDIDCEKEPLEAMYSEKGAMSFLTEAMHRGMETGELNEYWIQAARWYLKHEEHGYKHILEGMCFDNKVDSLGVKFADALYRGEKDRIEASASRLEKYSACPFAHFISYGLKPEEERIYEIGARELGDVYHECMMTLSQELTDGNGLTWSEVTYDQVQERIKSIIEDLGDSYREGLLNSGKVEEYRSERITDICTDAAWSLVEQVRCGSIDSMYFEQPFGMEGGLPPIIIKTDEGEVSLRGKIDRMDILAIPKNGTKAVRIIDYKTGGNTINLDHIKAGYKLQLMIYMKAALQSGEVVPGGVFYFKIKEVNENGDKKAVVDTSVKERCQEAYRLEGIVINDENIIRAMDTKFVKKSNVIPVKEVKSKGTIQAASGGILIENEGFTELEKNFDENLEKICGEICNGEIRIRPKKESNKDMEGNYITACKYCDYKSICKFDVVFKGCEYEWV